MTESIESQIAKYRADEARERDRARSFETQARAAEREAQIIAAKIQGMAEALELVRSAAPGNPVQIQARKRQRRLTGHWQSIMQIVNGSGEFSYDDLASAAVLVGHEVGRDTLRSQMSLYKTGGLVESVGDGVFRLTDAGRKAAEIAINDYRENFSPNENEAPNGDAAGASETGEVTASPNDEKDDFDRLS